MEKLNFIMLREEASRCLLCYEPPCSSSCPVEKNPASVIMSLRMDNYKGASIKAKEDLKDLGKCGDACGNKMYCQRNCTRGKIDRPIKIRMIQENLSDNYQP